MTEVRLDPGVCGMKSIVTCASDDGQVVRVSVESGCAGLSAVGEALDSVDAYAAVFSGMDASPVYAAVAKHCKHLGCPAASAIIKGIEVECGFALPRNFSAEIQKSGS